jgi:hypothetical protein
VQNAGPQAPSGHHLTPGTISPGKSYAAAAANGVLKTAPIDTHHQKNIAEEAAEKCTDGDMVTLITTVQQVMTGLLSL